LVFGKIADLLRDLADIFFSERRRWFELSRVFSFLRCFSSAVRSIRISVCHPQALSEPATSRDRALARDRAP
jgi:hypothetical protein